MKNNKLYMNFSGSYETRGFQSKIGVMWVSHADTDLILDFEIKCKKCSICDQHRAKGVIPQHDCSRNFEGKL